MELLGPEGSGGVLYQWGEHYAVTALLNEIITRGLSKESVLQ